MSANSPCLCRFLLKYASRDTVTLLARGTGGVVETRQAVEEYAEKSPLYGVVQYRRKKFILKYVPEGTSRILQGACEDRQLLRPELTNTRASSPAYRTVPICARCL